MLGESGDMTQEMFMAQIQHIIKSRYNDITNNYHLKFKYDSDTIAEFTNVMVESYLQIKNQLLAKVETYLNQIKVQQPITIPKTHDVSKAHDVPKAQDISDEHSVMLSIPHMQHGYNLFFQSSKTSNLSNGHLFDKWLDLTKEEREKYESQAHALNLATFSICRERIMHLLSEHSSNLSEDVDRVVRICIKKINTFFFKPRKMNCYSMFIMIQCCNIPFDAKYLASIWRSAASDVQDIYRELAKEYNDFHARPQNMKHLQNQKKQNSRGSNTSHNRKNKKVRIAEEEVAIENKF